MLIRVRTDGTDDVTIMRRFSLSKSELQTFKLIWFSGSNGAQDFQVNNESRRKYIWFLRKKLDGFGLEIVNIGNGRYVFTRESHEKIAELLARPSTIHSSQKSVDAA